MFGYCHTNGINGHCGARCCLESEGECPEPEEVLGQTIEMILKEQLPTSEIDFDLGELSEQYCMLERNIK